MKSLWDLSTSTYVYGIKTPNETWRSMKAVWDACDRARIDPPAEVYDYFNGEQPDAAGVVVDLGNMGIATYWHDPSNDMLEGFVIELSALPEDVTHIRVVHSY